MLLTQAWWIVCKRNVVLDVSGKDHPHTHTLASLCCVDTTNTNFVLEDTSSSHYMKFVCLALYFVKVFPTGKPRINGFLPMDAETVNSCEPVGKAFEDSL